MLILVPGNKEFDSLDKLINTIVSKTKKSFETENDIKVDIYNEIELNKQLNKHDTIYCYYVTDADELPITIYLNWDLNADIATNNYYLHCEEL